MPPSETDTERDTRTSLTLVLDLGQPSAGDVASCFQALQELWDWTLTVHAERSERWSRLAGRSVMHMAPDEASAFVQEVERRHGLTIESHGATIDILREILRPEKVQRHGPTLVVERLRLASPLEAVLTAATSTYAPIAYGVAGMAVLERAVRLLMAWQVHRQQLSGQATQDAQAELGLLEAVDLLDEAVPNDERPASMTTTPATTAGVAALQRLARYRIVSVQGQRAE